MSSLLQVKKLKKNFGGIHAVTDCNFEVGKGGIVALIGPNGAGKSTVFNLISGIFSPDEGEVIFEGRNIAFCSIEEIARLGVSRLLQHSRLFKNLTVKENLSLALNPEDTHFWKNLFSFNSGSKTQYGSIAEMLHRFGLEEIQDKIVEELSYGQRRLVDLTRTILHPHKILLLDEPVAGVHPSIRNDLSQLFMELKTQGETILFVEHDMTFTLKTADSMIVMNAGEVIAHGTPDEIQRDPRVIEAYLGESR